MSYLTKRRVFGEPGSFPFWFSMVIFLYPLNFIDSNLKWVILKKSKLNFICYGFSVSQSLASQVINLSRSSGQEVFCKKDTLRNFAKFTEKHLCQSLFLIKLQAYNLGQKVRRLFSIPLLPLIQCWRMQEKDKNWTGKFLRTHQRYFNIE